MVDRDACREGNTSLKVLALLAGESLLDFFLNQVINCAANGGNISTWDAEFYSLCEAG